MPDAKSKKSWEAANVVQVAVKINRNTDPELHRLLCESSSRSGLIRQLCVEALAARKTKEE